MITSPDMLRRDTVNTLAEINNSLTALEEQAKSIGIPLSDMRDSSNAVMAAPLLLAKVIAIQTLVQLNYNIQTRGQRS